MVVNEMKQSFQLLKSIKLVTISKKLKQNSNLGVRNDNLHFFGR